MKNQIHHHSYDSIFKRLFSNFFFTDKLDLHKLILGGILFFFIIGSYTVVKELQNIVFGTLVGANKVPLAKLLAILILIPMVFFDSFLADRVRRHTLLIIYLTSISFMLLTLSIFLPLDKMNLDTKTLSLSSGEEFSVWVFFLTVEMYMPCIVGTFWAFMNSISNPKGAEKTYAFVVCCSKIGGVITAILCYYFMSTNFSFFQNILDSTRVKSLIFLSAFMLLSALLSLQISLRKFSPEVFHGYRNVSVISEKVEKTGVLSGIKILMKNRYVLGIFMLIFCTDSLNEIVNYQRLLIMIEAAKKSTSGSGIITLSSIAYKNIIHMHIVGFLIAFLVTNGFMRFIGTKLSLFIMPTVATTAIMLYSFNGNQGIIMQLYVLLHALNYSIGTPVRESLYIIANKDIQLKSKFTIDAISLKSSKSFAQSFNYMNANFISSVFGKAGMIICGNIFMMTLCSIWIFTCYNLSKRYSEAIEKNEIIS